ncbi:MAG: cation-translocating P-type ATPase [Caldilineaceae bacterium]
MQTYQTEASLTTEPYRQPAAAVLQALAADEAQGLTGTEVKARLANYGANELTESGGRPRWQIFLEQMRDFLTLILIAAALISLFLGDVVDAIVILAIVILNAALGYSQESKAEQSMAALKRLSVPTVRVRRDGAVREISARDLVPGDIVLLETGNVVPADGRLLEGINLRVQESALTGESDAVNKQAELVFDSDRALGDRRNMVYSGTVVNYGHGVMVVTATGMATELGKIANMIQSVEQEKTPLQQRLDRLGKVLAAAAIVLVAVIFVIGVLNGQPVDEMLMTAISLAVAAIPEAMTAVVTIALALGAQRMLKRQALIRKLPAVETLGSVSVICSDKTGTLTENRMTVTVLDIANHHVDLTQTKADARYTIQRLEQQSDDQPVKATLALMLVSGALCNDALLEQQQNGEQGYYTVGDPTEGALVLAAAEHGIFKGELDKAFARVAEYPFDSVRKRMTTVHQMPASPDAIPASLRALWGAGPQPLPPFLAVTKGAIDGLLTLTEQVWVDGELHPFDESWRTRVMTEHDQLAQKGMRVLGVGIHALDEQPAPNAEESLEKKLILLGIFGMIDPPRPEVGEAVQICKRAGIRPVMITGDHPLTARHIAQQLGIAEDDRFITGQELDQLSARELEQKAQEISVFARVSPEHKLKLVQVYQALGYIAAMTGDGVNDAPALKKADMGVAMGITGTDVTKEAAEMVLLDDNFATIVAAVEEGRIIYDNIRKFIKYLLTCNTSEIAVMLFGPLLGMPLPLLPLQILWMNLVTDGLPALALGVEPAEANVMQRRPYSSQESIFSRGMGAFIIGMGIVLSLVALGVGLWSYRSGDPAWQSLLFTTLIFCQLALALSVRGEDSSLMKLGLLSNRSMAGALLLTVALQALVLYVPFFQGVFGTMGLGGRDLLIALGAGLLVLLIAELWKWARQRVINR